MDSSSVYPPFPNNCLWKWALCQDRHSIETTLDTWRILHGFYRSRSIVYMDSDDCATHPGAYIWDGEYGWLPVSLLRDWVGL